MIRPVELPAEIPGRLLRHSMTGSFEALERVWHQVVHDDVRAIIDPPGGFSLKRKA